MPYLHVNFTQDISSKSPEGLPLSPRNIAFTCEVDVSGTTKPNQVLTAQCHEVPIESHLRQTFSSTLCTRKAGQMGRNGRFGARKVSIENMMFFQQFLIFSNVKHP